MTLYSYAFSSLPNNITNKTPKDHKVYIQQILLPAYNYYEQCNILFLSSQAFEVLSRWYTRFTSNGLFANKLIKLKSKTLRFETYCTEWKKKHVSSDHLAPSTENTNQSLNLAPEFDFFQGWHS